MRFYVPAAKSPEKSENIYQAARKRHNALITEKRIRSITYLDVDTRATVRATVGRTTEYRVGIVMVILESDSNCYLVCTWGEGLDPRGQKPVVVSKDSVSDVEFFES
jgi:hypothetical protein